MPPNMDLEEDEEKWKKRYMQYVNFYEKSLKVQALLTDVCERFWFCHTYDGRGRTYSRGYHVHSQGSDYQKAVLTLADGERLNPQ